jgi:hypothetical protein
MDVKHEERSYKNIIRYNLSGPIVFGISYFVLGYERLIKPQQSFSINAGLTCLPGYSYLSTDSFNLREDVKNNGFNISADYRFYLLKENKFKAPHGVYVGPFYSFNRFTRDNIWERRRVSSVESITTSTQLDIHTIGVELGCQFVLWKRLALDVVMVGPGIANYHLNSKIHTNVTESERSDLQAAMIKMLTEKFPGLGRILADKEIDRNGTTSTWDYGLRYIVHIGYMF